MVAIDKNKLNLNFEDSLLFFIVGFFRAAYFFMNGEV